MRVDIAADGELVITKTNKDGVAMLIVDEDAAITYSFISKKVGQYDSLHRTDDVQLVELVEKFNAVADESPIKEDKEEKKWTDGDMMRLLDWCGGEEGFNLIEEGETTQSLFNKFLKRKTPNQ